MKYDIRDLDSKRLQSLAEHYEENGFCVLTGLEDVVTNRFRGVLAGIMQAKQSDFAKILDALRPDKVFDVELRKKLARVDTPADLAQSLLRVLEPILLRMLGPFIHVSSNFHAQFKGYPAKAVDHGGYQPGLDYMEVHGAYLLHQDFAGANIPTSPSAMTLWVGLNSCKDWTLRLFPGSHRHGLICSRWLALDDTRLTALNKPVDIQAEPGSAVIFNSLLLHGTSNAGALHRVSCDIRFFPMCGFLPSKTHILGANPCAIMRGNLKTAPGPTLQAPLLEDQVYLGGDVRLDHVGPSSILNWVNYIKRVLRGENDGALSHLNRFVNVEIGVDPPATFAAKFHGKPIQSTTLQSVHERLGEIEPSAPELVQLGRLIQELSPVNVAPQQLGAD